MTEREMITTLVLADFFITATGSAMVLVQSR